MPSCALFFRVARGVLLGCLAQPSHCEGAPVWPWCLFRIFRALGLLLPALPGMAGRQRNRL